MFGTASPLLSSYRADENHVTPQAGVPQLVGT
jgi:hypothetical protein